MFYSDSVMEMATDFIVTEAFGKGMKALLSDNANQANRAFKEANALKRSGDKVAAKKKYNEALKYANMVKDEVNKIEDETVLDWVISLCLKPWWVYLGQLMQADFNFSSVTRSSTMNIINQYINKIKIEMNS